MQFGRQRNLLPPSSGQNNEMSQRKQAYKQRREEQDKGYE
jgi:hypothetical protein